MEQEAVVMNEAPKDTIQPKDVTPPPPQSIALVKGDMTPKTAVELNAMLAKIAIGGGFPKRFENAEQRLAAYNLGHSLMGSRWQLCLNNIAPIQGQMTIFGELPGALAEQTKEVAEKHVYCIDEDHKKICIENKNLNAPAYSGVCIIQRKGREKKEFTYTLEEAKKAGQYPATKPEWVNNKRTGRLIENPDSPWMKFTKVMLMRKAMNLAVKFEFADAMVGVPVAEYDFDRAPDLVEERDVTEHDAAADLNKRFED